MVARLQTGLTMPFRDSAAGDLIFVLPYLKKPSLT